jgi:hypothetical protein
LPKGVSTAASPRKLGLCAQRLSASSEFSPDAIAVLESMAQVLNAFRQYFLSKLGGPVVAISLTFCAFEGCLCFRIYVVFPLIVTNSDSSGNGRSWPYAQTI